MKKRYKRRSIGSTLTKEYKKIIGECWWLYNYCVLSEIENANSRNTKSLTNCTMRRVK